MEVSFPYSISHRVKIRASGVTGRVVGLSIDRFQLTMVCVEYVNSIGDVKFQWFDSGDLERAND